MNENTITCAACGCIIESEEAIIRLPDGTTVCRDCKRILDDGSVVRCAECGNFVLASESIEYDGETLCADCRDSLDLEYCEECGEYHPADDFNEVYAGWRRHNYRLCSSCTSRAVDNGTIFWCDDCESYNDSDSIGYYNTVYGTTICSSCYDDSYCCCSNCGDVLRTDDAFWDDDDEEWYCRDCYQPHSNRRRIHDYSFRPEAVFHGLRKTFSWESPAYGDPITIGFELEVDGGGDREDCSEELTDTFDENTLYLKYDSSVDFEIVTHPHTLEAYMNELDIDKLCSIPRKHGYQSHNAGTCGLHCHVGRTQLGKDSSEREEVISRIALLMYRHWNSLVVFSRRKETQLTRWASEPAFNFEYDKTYNSEELNNFVHRYYARRGRYQALNLEPSRTIEFRLWRGTLIPGTLKATLQLTSNIVEFCMNRTLEQVVNSTWEEVTGYKSFNELTEYLKSRDLVSGRETKAIPFDNVVISSKDKYGFEVGDYVRIENSDGDLVSSGVLGALGTVAGFQSDFGDDQILILLDTSDPITSIIASAYGHWAGGRATANNGYWVYRQNIAPCSRRA